MRTPCSIPDREAAVFGLESEPVPWSLGARVAAALVSATIGSVFAYCMIQLWLYGQVFLPGEILAASSLSLASLVVFSVGAGCVAGLGSVMLHLARDGLYDSV